MENTTPAKEEVTIPGFEQTTTTPDDGVLATGDVGEEGPIDEVDDQAPINTQPDAVPTGIASRPIIPAYQSEEAPQTDLSVEGQRNDAVDHGEQSALAEEPVIPDSAFGPMDTIEVNAADMAVRVMCWHLSASGVLGNRTIVNIADDAEAIDILKSEDIPVSPADEEGLYSVTMGFKSLEGYLSSRVMLTDKSIRMLALRAVNYKYSRQDPEVADAMQRYFAHVDQQTKAK